jgi:hypothetical protein
MVGHEEGQPPCLNIAGKEVSVIVDNLCRDDKAQHEHAGPWRFDVAMDSSDDKSPNFVSNDKCYEYMGKPLVDQVLNGYNSCLFCYGQTGTGKTATIMGYPELGKGLLPRMLDDLMEKAMEMRKDGCTVKMEVQMLEVYNEKINDLLMDRKHWDDVHIKTMVMPNGVLIKGASSIEVDSVEQCLKLVDEGQKRQTVAATLMNPRSSRGHMVLKFSLEKLGGPDGMTLHSEVYFADLAGHESIKLTAVKGERLTELKHINSSLMYLQRAIHSLAVGSSKRPAAAKRSSLSTPDQDKGRGRSPSPSPSSRTMTHTASEKKPDRVNYSVFRNSELTLLLANGLTGNSKTAVIVTLSPAAEHFETSLSSIEFGLEVKGIKLDVHSTMVMDPAVQMKRLEAEVASLKEQLSAALGGQPLPLGIASSDPAVVPGQPGDAASDREQVELMTKENQDLKAQLRKMKMRSVVDSIKAQRSPSPAPPDSRGDADEVKRLKEENAELKATLFSADKPGHPSTVRKLAYLFAVKQPDESELRC